VLNAFSLVRFVYAKRIKILSMEALFLRVVM